jgi:hypothetical protein
MRILRGLKKAMIDMEEKEDDDEDSAEEPEEKLISDEDTVDRLALFIFPCPH